MAGGLRRDGDITGVAIAFEGALLLAAVALGWLLNQNPLEQMEWRWGDAALGAGATVPLLVAFALGERYQWKWFRGLAREVEQLLRPLLARRSIVAFGAISLLAGVGEESLFRGVLQRALADWLGVPLAVVFASVLFGLAHSISTAYILVAAAIGCYLGCLLVITDNLLAPMLAHGLYDFVALIGLSRKYAREPHGDDESSAMAP